MEEKSAATNHNETFLNSAAWSLGCMKGMDNRGQPYGGADMVMLDANPLDDIANATKISGVMLRGQWLSKADIQAVQEQLQSEYAADRELLASIMPAQ